MAPTKFDDLAKKSKDLLNDDFVNGKSAVQIQTKAPNGIEFTATKGDMKAKMKHSSGVAVEAKHDTKGQLKTKTTVDKMVDGLKLIVNTQSSGANVSSGKLGMEFSNASLFANAEMDLVKAGNPASAAVTLGLGVDGLEGGANLNMKSLSSTPDWAAGIKYKVADAEATAHVCHDYSYLLTYYHKLANNTTVGGQVVAGTTTKLTFGGAYTVDDATYKAKYETEEDNLSVSYSQKMNKNVTLILGSKASVKDASVGDFGFEFKYSA